MLGTKFVLDEEKIQRDGKYDLDRIYELIEQIATTRAKLTKIDKNHYVFKGEKDAPAYLGILVYNHLAEYDWFMANVKEWLWLDDDEGDTDIIALLAKHKERILA